MKNENIYYLKNNYGEYQKITKEIGVIKSIYIDECNQSLQNNILNTKNIENTNELQEHLKYIEQWSRKIENCICNKYTIEEIIEQLNKEHNWCIEILNNQNKLETISNFVVDLKNSEINDNINEYAKIESNLIEYLKLVF